MTTITAIDFGNLQPLEIFVAFLVLFVACLLLTFIVKTLLATKNAKKQEISEEVTQEETPIIAKGSCGDLRLINTDDRTAAMIMAIVADKTETPLNQLRFISIEKKGDK